jgi:hypothetical protein
MDALLALVESLSKNEAIEEDVRSQLSAIIETRTSNRWAKAEEENAKAKEEAAKALAKAPPRKSAAIRIEVRIIFP